MKQDYTAAELCAQVCALQNMFDTVWLIDPGQQCLLDPATLQPTAEPCRLLPRLDASGRCVQPLHTPAGLQLSFCQAVCAAGHSCILLAGYAAPQADPAAGRDDQAMRRAMNQYVQDLYRDYVTGVYNTRYLDEEYRPALRERIAGGETFSAALVRVNEYGRILREEGSDAADRCLTVAAGILQIAAGMEPEKGILARLSGGVFLVTAVATPAPRLHETLRAALCGGRRVYSTSFSRRSEFTASVGAADWGETGSWDMLLALAEQRMLEV